MLASFKSTCTHGKLKAGCPSLLVDLGELDQNIFAGCCSRPKRTYCKWQPEGLALRQSHNSLDLSMNIKGQQSHERAVQESNSVILRLSCMIDLAGSFFMIMMMGVNEALVWAVESLAIAREP